MGRLLRAVKILAKVTRQVSLQNVHWNFFIFNQLLTCGILENRFCWKLMDSRRPLQEHWVDCLVNAPTLEKQKELWYGSFDSKSVSGVLW